MIDQYEFDIQLWSVILNKPDWNDGYGRGKLQTSFSLEFQFDLDNLIIYRKLITFWNLIQQTTVMSKISASTIILEECT